jgi:hypothetical protein
VDQFNRFQELLHLAMSNDYDSIRQEHDSIKQDFDSVRQKVLALFSELVGERTARLNEPGAGETRKTLTAALSEDFPPDTARELAFHLVDWHSDAAFIMAVHLFPERFTPQELCAGARLLLVHAPNHLAAAAKLAGNPVEDIFEVGIFDDDYNDQKT